MLLDRNAERNGKYHYSNCNYKGNNTYPWLWAVKRDLDEILKTTLNKEGVVQPCKKCFSHEMKKIK